MILIPKWWLTPIPQWRSTILGSNHYLMPNDNINVTMASAYIVGPPVMSSTTAQCEVLGINPTVQCSNYKAVCISFAKHATVALLQ